MYLFFFFFFLSGIRPFVFPYFTWSIRVSSPFLQSFDFFFFFLSEIRYFVPFRLHFHLLRGLSVSLFFLFFFLSGIRPFVMLRLHSHLLRGLPVPLLPAFLQSFDVFSPLAYINSNVYLLLRMYLTPALHFHFICNHAKYVFRLHINT